MIFSTVDLPPSRGFIGDITDFWEGAPFVLDCDAIIGRIFVTEPAVGGWTVLFNRIFLILNTPYFMISVLFISGVFFEITRRILQWIHGKIIGCLNMGRKIKKVWRGVSLSVQLIIETNGLTCCSSARFGRWYAEVLELGEEEVQEDVEDTRSLMRWGCEWLAVFKRQKLSDLTEADEEEIVEDEFSMNTSIGKVNSETSTIAPTTSSSSGNSSRDVVSSRDITPTALATPCNLVNPIPASLGLCNNKEGSKDHGKKGGDEEGSTTPTAISEADDISVSESTLSDTSVLVGEGDAASPILVGEGDASSSTASYTTSNGKKNDRELFGNGESLKRDIESKITTPLTLDKLVKNSISKTKTESRPYWKIYGREYDLTEFMDIHPGGEFALQVSKNSDCTILFESYHIFCTREKLAKMMARYELINGKTQIEEAKESSQKKLKKKTDSSTTTTTSSINATKNERRLVLPAPDPLHEDLKEYVRGYFKEYERTGESFTDKGWKEANCLFRTFNFLNSFTVGRPHHLTGFVALIMFILACTNLYMQYRLLFLGDITAAVVFPVIQWIFGAGLAHDSSHFACVKNSKLNRILSFIGGWPIMFNSSAWVVQHVVQHHQFTNSMDDVDLFHFLPLVRSSKLTKYEAHHRFQLALILLLLPTTSLHLNFAVPVDLLMEQPVFVGPFDKNVNPEDKWVFRYNQCKHLRTLMQHLKWPMFIETLMVLGWWITGARMLGTVRFICLLSVCVFFSSWTFILFTQGAHLREDTMTNADRNSKKRELYGADSVHPEDIVGFQNTYGPEPEPSEDLYKNDKSVVGKIPNHPNPLMGRWVREQLAYTADFRTDSYLWYFLSGGLNMQSIHHCMPGISHSHYTALYPGFLKVLEKHGVTTKIDSSTISFMWGFFRWIGKLQYEDLGYEQRETLDWGTEGNENPELKKVQ